MRTSLFGLDKQSVQQALNKLKQSQEHELDKLREQRSQSERRRDELRLQLEAMQRMYPQPEEEGAEEWLLLARSRVEDTIRRMQLAPGDEWSAAKQDQRELLGEAEAAASAEARHSEGAAITELAGRFAATTQTEAVLADGGIVQEAPSAGPLPVSGKVVQLTSSASKRKNAVLPLNKAVSPTEGAATAAAAVQSQSSVRREKTHAVGIGFWGDMDKYLEADEATLCSWTVPQPTGSAGNAPSAPTANAAQTAHRHQAAADAAQPMAGGDASPAPRGLPAVEPSAAAAMPADASDQAPTASTAEPTAGQRTVADAERDSIPDPGPAAEKASPALSAEIEAIRQKYIVGKIAGDDLRTVDGRLLIAKHEVISAETVQQADAAGKLAELIVAMIIPGLGEEE